MKRIMAVALSVGMMTAGSMTGYGETVNPSSSEVVVKKGSSTPTEIFGTIKVTQLNVTLPLRAAFDIDPGAYATATTLDDVMAGRSDNYKIVNNSAVPVWVYITGVEEGDKNGGNKGAVITTAKSDLTKAKNVMVAIKKTPASAPVIGTQDTAVYWLSKDGAVVSASKPYYMDTDTTGLSANHGKIEAASSSAGTEMPLTIYALTKTGWTSGDTFAVSPTFTVSVTDPEPSATP